MYVCMCLTGVHGIVCVCVHHSVAWGWRQRCKGGISSKKQLDLNLHCQAEFNEGVTFFLLCCVQILEASEIETLVAEIEKEKEEEAEKKKQKKSS